MTTILLQFADKTRQQNLAEILRDKNFHVVGETAAAHPQTPVDAVLADQSAQPDSQSPPDPNVVRDPVAVGAIGWSGPADVVLPEDVTDRELKLVCSLLAEITRLRRECTRRHRERTEMQQLAYSDSLTNVPNRRAWNEEVERQFEFAKLSSTPLALAILDLDHFKEVNDRYGHPSGDAVLKGAARAISASVRASDFLARLGGDEFGLLLPEVAANALPRVMERIRRSVATHCSRPAGPNISVSIGYALRKDENDFERLFDRCDAALRHAKTSGRDQAVQG